MHSVVLVVCFIQLFAVSAVLAADFSLVSFVRTEESSIIELDTAVSSELVNLTRVTSSAECLVRCRIRDCALTSLRADGLCQMLVINDASQRPGPLGSHRLRSVELAAGSGWKAADFEQLLQRRRFSNNFSMSFLVCSRGRNGSVQTAVISLSGCYRIEASGALGGANTLVPSKRAGLAVTVSGNFSLTEGNQLWIVVGQAGQNSSAVQAGAGGGGGSFVYNQTTLYVAAGGGGGASSWYSGRNAVQSVNATNSYPCTACTNYTGFGGANGQPGFSNLNSTKTGHFAGGCGAGWLGGQLDMRLTDRDGGAGGGRQFGWLGGAAGGSSGGAGGFGGYSGGGAGLDVTNSGGGGGSFCSGSGCTFSQWTEGHGVVSLTLLSPPGTSC